MEGSLLNKLQRLVHYSKSNLNPTSSRDDTSFWIRLTPCWTSHRRDMWPNTNIFLQRSAHITIEVIWIKPMFMVFKSPRLILSPKTMELGSQMSSNVYSFYLCISHSYFLQCKTLHNITRRAPINLLDAIPTHNLIDCYTTLSNYRKHTLWNTWWPRDR